MTQEKISERDRAEDILLGSLGFGEDARIVTLSATESGYHGIGKFGDGEEFSFESLEDLDDLQRWALRILEATHYSE